MSDHRKHRPVAASGVSDAQPSSASPQPRQRPPPSIQSPGANVSSPSISQPSSPKFRPKLPIPRLRRNTDGPPTGASSGSADSKNRVNHACEPCRHRKTKCSGERPVCKHCQDFKIQCNYADGKRDRTKKEYNIMAARVTACEGLLRDLSDRVCEADQLRIRKTLADESTHIAEEASSPGSLPRMDERDRLSFQTEHQATGRAGSTSSLDCIDEDFNRSDASRTTGFMGKNSEVAWLGKLRKETDSGLEDEDQDNPSIGFGSGLDESHAPPAKEPKKHLPLSESNYYCDDVPLSIDDSLQPYQLPASATADLLLACYLECVHPAFPILGKTTFLKQYNAFYGNPNLKTGPRWLAVLNLVFAIGARYGLLIRAEWRELADGHEVYFARARLLGLDAGGIWRHAELQRIQVHALASFYLLATHQINRAFIMSGLAVRQALMLGLNLRNNDQHLAESSKEIRYRVWWAIASTERTLCVMTGRPTSFVGDDCSTPLPLPLEEESFMAAKEPYETGAVRMLRRLSTDEGQSTDMSASTPASSVSSMALSPNTPLWRHKPPLGTGEAQTVKPCDGLFFLYSAKLHCLDDEVMKLVYRPHIIKQSWATIQSVVSRFQKKAVRWQSALPVVFDFTRNQRDQSFLRQRMCLGFAYYSTMMIINRPFLCKIEEKIPNESTAGKDFDRAGALSCVLAAKSLIDLLPDEPNPVGMYQVSPWWNMVHHLMQAGTVLMLEMSLRATHCPDMSEDLLKAAQKAVAWLQSMATDDLAAARAWRLSSDVLRKVAPRIGRKMDDRLARPLEPTPDMTMQGLVIPEGDYNLPGPSDYSQASTTGMDFGNYPPVTSWEPLMFTNYDNYLLGNEQTTTQGPSPQQWDQYYQ